MLELSFHQISIEPISLPSATAKDVRLSALRLDKIDHLISGNKWFKLRLYLDDAIKQNKKTIVTFGGAWSNHILATARACQLYGLHSIGIIRGEEPSIYSKTFIKAKEFGMQFRFLSREDYAAKRLPSLSSENNFYLVPEGGYGELGANGAATIAEHFHEADYSHICCAVGTGTMIAGLRNAVSSNVEINGISVMKNNLELEESARKLLINQSNHFQIYHDYHFGGYAKYNDELITFMNLLYKQTGIPTDFVYTGKLFYAVNDMVEKGVFPAGSNILVIHSGGLQGNESLGKGTLIF